ncbi:unnamed protein product [Linum tenue]|uniref:Uncharacterized protein n=1 Tax=Linum tenue TaxID=586396 RepID=A0AAV0L2I2_9ROSI|nr:unnamed protein product [Linum tenue]
MADPVKLRRLLISSAPILYFILCSSILFLLPPSPNLPHKQPPPPLVLPPGVHPTAAKIAQALHSRGNYSAMIPDLVSQFDPGCLRGGAALTIFVPTDRSEYHVCGSERPGFRVVRSRVDRAAFGSSLTNGSVLETCDGGGEIRVVELTSAAEIRYLHNRVVDWNLYDGGDDGGQVVVHGIDGQLGSDTPVAAVGRFAVSGLVKQRREDAAGDEFEKRCRGSWMDIVLPPRTTDMYREVFIRRVDGLPIPVLGW